MGRGGTEQVAGGEEEVGRRPASDFPPLPLGPEVEFEFHSHRWAILQERSAAAGGFSMAVETVTG